MKKNSFLPIIGLLSTILSVTFSYANDPRGSAASNTYSLHKFLMPVLFDETADKKAMETLKLASTKAHKDFSKFFKNATDIHIAVTKNNTFISCMIDGIRNRVLYNSKGKWIHTLKYYSAEKLPKDVHKSIRYAYPDFSMTYVTEVQVRNKTAFLVNIEDNTSLKTIRVLDGEMDVYKEYSKQ